MPRSKKRQPGPSRALYEEFRARIADGSYAAGMALPSTRALAAERGLPRATVSGVYEQLAADGFIDSRPGAATQTCSCRAALIDVPFPCRASKRGWEMAVVDDCLWANADG